MVFTQGSPLARNISLLLGLGAALLAMPNPLIYMPLGIFFGFVPLFAANQKSSGYTRFLFNLLFSCAFAIILLNPLDAAKLVYVFPDTIFIVILFLIIGSIYSISFTSAGFLSDKFGWDLGAVFFSLCWLLTQRMLSAIPPFFAFPIETSLVKYPVMIQSAGIFGASFIGCWIIFTNSVIANAIYSKKWLISLIILLTVHLTNICYGIFSLSFRHEDQNTVPISIIQTNVSSRDYVLIEKSRLFENLCSRKLISLSLEALKKQPKLIIWPELAGNYILQNDQYLEYLCRSITSKGAELLIGTNYIDHLNGRKEYNISFILKSDGNITEPYKKSIVFPFSETSLYSRGGEFKTLPSGSGLKSIGSMICLESFYPRIARGLVKAGAKILVLISTDASFGNSMIPYIHAAQIVMRAVENDRYAVHLGNTGPSIICDNKGRILTYVPYGKAAYAEAKI